jgi:alkylhydroperoxidase family enzyme
MSAFIPRLEMPDMSEDLSAYLQPRVKRLGYLGELFKCAGHAPQVLLHFMHFTDALKDALPDRLAETAVLTVASFMGNSYERNQHERLCVRLGFGREWIADVEKMQPDQAQLMTDSEKAIQRFTMASLASRGHANQQQFEALSAMLTPAQAMALVMLIGRYMTHAMVVNTLQLAPPVPSIFEDGFNG